MYLTVLPAMFPEESYARKGSTASLSHIEGELHHVVQPVSLRTNSSTHNLSRSMTADTWGSDVEQPTYVGGTPAGDGVTSPVSTASTKSTGKFFVFGGTRTARKQRQVRNVTLLTIISVCFIF